MELAQEMKMLKEELDECTYLTHFVNLFLVQDLMYIGFSKLMQTHTLKKKIKNEKKIIQKIFIVHLLPYLKIEQNLTFFFIPLLLAITQMATVFFFISFFTSFYLT